jgi:hypothetical protein
LRHRGPSRKDAWDIDRTASKAIDDMASAPGTASSAQGPIDGVDPLSCEVGSARRLMADIVSEPFPADGIVFRTPCGETYTAERMRREILEGSGEGRAYATSMLRVCRDLLMRQARRGSDAKAKPGQADAPSPGA